MLSLVADVDNKELYIEVVPAKYLFRSTMVHEVITRGDRLAVRVSDSQLVILRPDPNHTKLEGNVIVYNPCSPFYNEGEGVEAEVTIKTKIRGKRREL